MILPTGVLPTAVALNDINGDGKLDIFASINTDNALSVYQNTGSAGVVSFASAANYIGGNGPQGVAIADFDGDNLPDLAEGNFLSNNVSVLRNTGLYAPTITSFAPANGPVGASVIITGTNFNITAANNKVYFGAIGITPSAATATSLTVAVPAGATSITPLVVQDVTTGLQASSITSTTPQFIVTNSPAVLTNYTVTSTVAAVQIHTRWPLATSTVTARQTSLYRIRVQTT